MGSCFSSKPTQNQTNTSNPPPESNTHESTKNDTPQQQPASPPEGTTSQQPAFDPFSSEHDTGAPRKPSAFELASASYAPATAFAGPEGKKDDLPAIVDEEERDEGVGGRS